jgi:hypothetical protein
MNTDLSFITNEENQSLKKRFEVLIKDTSFFDCLVGYFFLPENRLDEVKNFVTFILSQDKDKKRKIIQMRGIWKGKGFEGLDIDK